VTEAFGYDNRIHGAGANPQSYRDPSSRVVLAEESVTRHLGTEAAAWFRGVEETGLLVDLVADGLLQPFERTEIADGSMIVVSPRIPFVTYPSEWTTSMLKDAALLTLEIIDRAWDREVHVRDASAFNVVFDGGRPVFVDHGSFRPGHTPFWLAYGQFCDHFLNPLALNALTGTPQRTVWDSSLEGLSAADLRGILGLRSLRRGLLRHVYVRAALERGGDGLDAGARRELRSEFGVAPDKTRGLIDTVARQVRRLEPTAPTAWVGYEDDNSYSVEEAAVKEQALRELVGAVKSRRLSVDLGANTGRYSLVLTDYFDQVVALDFAEGAVESLYQRIRSGEAPRRLTTGVSDLLDPTPGRGVLNEERPALLDRLSGADLFVWLALVHHLVISRNVPLQIVATAARRLGPTHIIEHIGPGDPMSQLLSASKTEGSWPSDRAEFERAMGEVFEIVAVERVTQYRHLYLYQAPGP